MPVPMLKRVGRQLLILEGLALVPLGAIIYLAIDDGAQHAREINGYIGQLALGGAAIALWAIGLISAQLLRRKLKTLTKFEDATRRLTNGDYSRRVDVDVHDEFQTLARAFNELTDQLQESLDSGRSLADIDRLILASANMDTILFKVLATAQMEAVEITLLLRHETGSARISTYRMEHKRVVEDFVSFAEVTDDTLRDIVGYREIANRLSNNDLLECLAIEEGNTITGVLVATGDRPLKASESKRLTDLVDRLSVAVTNIRRSESLFQQATFDALTGLINRHAFEGKLKECLAGTRNGENGVLLFIDLDGFKKVNDTEGHEAGDRLLMLVGDRLRETMSHEDIIARLGGDEFAIIVPGVNDGNTVSILCEKIIEAVTQPVVVDRMEHTIGASIGVALFPDDGTQVEEVVMKADSAMYRAKELGGSKFSFFDDTLNEANRHRILVESRLRSAVKEGHLLPHFQPKLNLHTWSMDSAEALMRWRDEELGEVQTEMFVSIAEETTLIHDFMPILVEHAASLINAAERAGAHLTTVAINASPKQLMADGFALTLLSLLDRFQIAHERIELEVTETVFARDTEQVVNELDILRSTGMRVALDDFGTGYSSLNMLRELPLDSLKIDRKFITELETSSQARVLVQHLISIASTLGLNVVAEGVETDVQLQHLLDTDCDYIQGFLISKALPQVDFIHMIVSWQASAHRGDPNAIDLSRPHREH